MNIFENKVAIITGGASGIGKAVGDEMARRGAIVILTDRNAPLLDETASSLIKAGHKANGAVLDVTDRDAVKKLVDDTVAEYGRLDFMFNNAGIGVFGLAHQYEYDDWKKVIDTNLYGCINGVFAAYPIMIKQGFGHIINTASLAGIVPLPGEISYTTSKFAIVGLSNSLRVEAEKFGVRVSVVCPGLIDTPIYHTSKIINFERDKALSEFPKTMPAETCALSILRGVERNKATIVVTGGAKFLWYMHRFSHSLSYAFAKLFAKQMDKFRTSETKIDNAKK